MTEGVGNLVTVETLPEPVAAAVVDSISGSLVENPRRCGRELRNELVGGHS